MYLHGGAIPSIFLNSPSYLSSVTTSRESPDSRRIRLENSTLKTALNASIIDDLAYKKQKKFYNLDDIEGKLNFLDKNYWSVIRQQDTHYMQHHQIPISTNQAVSYYRS